MTTDDIQTEKEQPNRGLLKYILLIGLLVLLYVSNPSREDHQNAVKSKINEILRNQVTNGGNNEGIFEKAGTELGLMLGDAIVNKFVEQIVDRKNYLFFFLTTVNYDGREKIIGIGIFGNVFISNGVENQFQKAKDELNSGTKDSTTVDTTSNIQNNAYGNTSDVSGTTPDTMNTIQTDTTLNSRNESIRDTQLGQTDSLTYIVNADENAHVHFFSSPDFGSKRNAYFAETDTVKAIEIRNGFAYIEFTNSMYQTSKGWIPLKNLTLLK